MGYQLTIGELPPDNPSLAPAVIYRENAPAFGEPTDYTNQRLPRFSDWRDFTKETGLFHLFFNTKDGLLKDHPGSVNLTSKHKQEVDKALKAYERKKDKNEYHHNRLVWLKFWVDWTLKYCKHPVFHNE